MIRERLQWITSRIQGLNDTVNTTHMQNSKGYMSRQLIRMMFRCSYLKKMQAKLLYVAHYVRKVYLYAMIYITVM